MTVTDGFRGWDEDCQRFFIGLELDNSKRYFDAHRDVYQRAVRGPMENLLASLEKDYGPGKVFRINRDVRFSKDKTPYKTNVSGYLYDGNVAWYSSLDARRLLVAAGTYHTSPERLERFRRSVAGPAGTRLSKIVEDLEQKGYVLDGEELKVVPRGFPRDHPRARLLRHRWITADRTFPLRPWLGTAECRDRIVQTWEAARPLADWLAEHCPP